MNNFTPRAQQVLQMARKEAERFHHGYVGTEHLLLGLIALGQGVAVNVLMKMGGELETIRLEVEKSVGMGNEEMPASGNLPFTPRVKKVLALASSEARALNHSYIGTEHILLGILREGEGVAARILKNLNIDLERTRLEIIKELDPNFEQTLEEAVSGNNGNEEVSLSVQDTKTPALNTFGRDLTELASRNELDPVIGRANEIERVIQILCRRTKNNPVLLGEAGVGKTAIVEGLAQSISAGNVPEILREKRLITLDLALMVAGTKYRGQFEERIKTVMDEIKRAKNILLFIDELHMIVGAGSAEGAMDASNIIKPALSRGELQCIGATTIKEYRKFIEKDAALERRFQSVMVNEPSVSETIEILKGLRYKYEEHHHAQISDEAIKAASELSSRYLTNRFLPDKAIDVIDEAGARSRIASMTRPPDLKDQEKNIAAVKKKKEESIRAQKFEEAASFRDEERQLRENMESVLTEWRKKRDEVVVSVSANDVRIVISKWTGIPLSTMEEQEMSKLLRMEEELGRSVIGQKEAVSAISKALRRSRADLKDPRRPIGSFVFLGPTGVGKTLLAKTLAEFMFNDPEALIQVDMSEYMEKFASSRMVGSPPGYVGHDEGGQLTEKVRRRPYSVVLFDEVEKAHPDVMHLLLQILEEGKLTDSLGRVVDFRNTVVILTSNLGADFLKGGGRLGFGNKDTEADYQALKTKMLEASKKVFKPELLNRIDDVIVFRQLEKSDIEQIFDIEIGRIKARVSPKHIELNIAAKAKEFLLTKGFDQAYGARPLRRALAKYLEDPLAEELIRGNIREGESIEVITDDEKLKFEQLTGAS